MYSTKTTKTITCREKCRNALFSLLLSSCWLQLIKWGRGNENYWSVLPCDILFMTQLKMDQMSQRPLKKSYDATIQTKAIEQYCPTVLFGMLQKMVLIFVSVELKLKVWSLKCCLSRYTRRFYLWISEWNRNWSPFKLNVAVYFIKAHCNFLAVDEILWCNY